LAFARSRKHGRGSAAVTHKFAIIRSFRALTASNSLNNADGAVRNADPSPMMIIDLAISFTGQQMEISIEFVRKH
jgi:hypothetical protein